MIIFADFDGTITQADVTDRILEEFAAPAWRDAEEAWVRGEIGSRECLARQMALVKASRAQLNALIDSVPLDPGALDFFRLARRWRTPVYVLSEGFDYVIRRVLRRCGPPGVRSQVGVFSSHLEFEGSALRVSFPYALPGCKHGCATCKPLIMRQAGEGRHPVVFVGDGLSDRFAVEAADTVFAKHVLLQYCLQRGIPCQRFETLANVTERLQQQLARRGLARRRRVAALTPR
jgi:2-hydroxy-3-keto-5-methylthiopentenyl-1-phosphate phosphatase